LSNAVGTCSDGNSFSTKEINTLGEEEREHTKFYRHYDEKNETLPRVTNIDNFQICHNVWIVILIGGGMDQSEMVSGPLSISIG
jgi:hypothetical protein